MRSSLISLAVVTVACGASRDPMPSNASGGSAVRVGPNQSLGWLALATQPAEDTVESFGPRNSEHPLVATVARGELPASVSAIGPSGTLQTFRTGAATKIPYGCDGNQLEVTAFAGPRLPPGPAWILPVSRPANWQPIALAIKTATSSPAQRSYALGPLAIDLVRTADLKGTLAITRDGRAVHTMPFERHPMEGAEPGPIDLDEGGPGIPEPIAAWALADNGPILLVLTQPGYEGMTLRPHLVEETSARAVEPMEMYLYSCAF